MVSHNGTAGHSASRVQEFEYVLACRGMIIMHSDGLRPVGVSTLIQDLRGAIRPWSPGYFTVTPAAAGTTSALSWQRNAPDDP